MFCSGYSRSRAHWQSWGYPAAPSRVWTLQAGRGASLEKWGEPGCSGDPGLPEPGWVGHQGRPPPTEVGRLKGGARAAARRGRAGTCCIPGEPRRRRRCCIQGNAFLDAGEISPLTKAVTRHCVTIYSCVRCFHCLPSPGTLPRLVSVHKVAPHLCKHSLQLRFFSLVPSFRLLQVGLITNLMTVSVLRRM